MSGTIYLHRSCPACGQTSTIPGWRVNSVPPAEDLPFADLQSSWRGCGRSLLRAEAGFDLLRHFLFVSGLGRVPLPELSSWTVGLKLGNISAVGRRP
jgi:hypothetical protein